MKKIKHASKQSPKQPSKQLWFKAKRYGWGWYPVTWQGWLILAVYIGLNVLNFLRIDGKAGSASDTLFNFLPETFALTAILLFLCYKTGEKPGWHWGK